MDHILRHCPLGPSCSTEDLKRGQSPNGTVDKALERQDMMMMSVKLILICYLALKVDTNLTPFFIIITSTFLDILL